MSNSNDLSDDGIRSIWKAAGGTFYGPNVEHGDMEEARLLPFLRRILSDTNGAIALQVETINGLYLAKQERDKEIAALKLKLASLHRYAGCSREGLFDTIHDHEKAQAVLRGDVAALKKQVEEVKRERDEARSHADVIAKGSDAAISGLKEQLSNVNDRATFGEDCVAYFNRAMDRLGVVKEYRDGCGVGVCQRMDRIFNEVLSLRKQVDDVTRERASFQQAIWDAYAEMKIRTPPDNGTTPLYVAVRALLSQRDAADAEVARMTSELKEWEDADALTDKEHSAIDAAQAEVAELRSERQREHDLRVNIAGELETAKESLRKIAAMKPGDTGVDMGRPGGDCRTCEEMIDAAKVAIGDRS